MGWVSAAFPLKLRRGGAGFLHFGVELEPAPCDCPGVEDCGWAHWQVKRDQAQ
jgi:hypothetical protein